MKSFKQIAALAVILLLPVMASAEWGRTVGAWDTRLPNKGKTQVALWGSYSKTEVANADFADKYAVHVCKVVDGVRVYDGLI